MRQRLELRSAESQKFWEIQQQGDQTTVRYGRIGAEGQTRTKTHASPEAAAAEAERLVRSKTAKGYAAADDFQVGSAPSVPLPSGAAPPSGAVSLYAVRRADAGGALVPARRLREAARTLSWARGALQRFERAVMEAPVAEPVGARQEGEDAKAYSKRRLRAMFAKFDQVTPETRDAAQALVRKYEGLFEGPRAALLREPFAGDMPRAAVEGLEAEVRAIGAALAALELPVGLHNPAASLQRFVGPKLDVPKLDPAAFDALSTSDRLGVFVHPQRWDCAVEDLDGGRAKAASIVGEAGVEGIIAQLWEAAEDSNADNEALSGEPWISVEVLRRGDQTLGYQISGHLEVEPYGGDFTYDLFANAQGKPFEQSFR